MAPENEPSQGDVDLHYLDTLKDPLLTYHIPQDKPPLLRDGVDDILPDLNPIQIRP